MCDQASVTPEPEPRDTGARVMESGDSHQYRIISDIREGFKKKEKKVGIFPLGGRPPLQKLGKNTFLKFDI